MPLEVIDLIGELADLEEFMRPISVIRGGRGLGFSPGASRGSSVGFGFNSLGPEEVHFSLVPAANPVNDFLMIEGEISWGPCHKDAAREDEDKDPVSGGFAVFNDSP